MIFSGGYLQNIHTAISGALRTLKSRRFAREFSGTRNVSSLTNTAIAASLAAAVSIALAMWGFHAGREAEKSKVDLRRSIECMDAFYFLQGEAQVNRVVIQEDIRILSDSERKLGDHEFSLFPLYSVHAEALKMVIERVGWSGFAPEKDDFDTLQNIYFNILIVQRTIDDHDRTRFDGMGSGNQIQQASGRALLTRLGGVTWFADSEERIARKWMDRYVRLAERTPVELIPTTQMVGIHIPTGGNPSIRN